MKDLGEASYIHGIKVYRDRFKRMIGLSQKMYIEEVLKRFGIKNFKRDLSVGKCVSKSIVSLLMIVIIIIIIYKFLLIKVI